MQLLKQKTRCERITLKEVLNNYGLSVIYICRNFLFSAYFGTSKSSMEICHYGNMSHMLISRLKIESFQFFCCLLYTANHVCFTLPTTFNKWQLKDFIKFLSYFIVFWSYFQNAVKRELKRGSVLPRHIFVSRPNIEPEQGF